MDLMPSSNRRINPLTLQNPIPIFKSIPPTHRHRHTPTLDLDGTKQTHAHLIRTHFHHSRLIPDPTFGSSQFNFLITSYTLNKRPIDALRIYSHMRFTHTFIDNFTLPSILKSCGRISMIQVGKEIHGYVIKIGLDWDVFVHNALIQMYSECGDLGNAGQVFEKMPERDVVSYSTMIRSYGRFKFFDEALSVIKQMHCSLVKPSDVAVINMASLFANMAVLTMARSMHAYAIKNSSTNSSSRAMGVVPVDSALLDMYIKCGSVGVAQQIFNRMVEKNVVSWTSMIAGYVRCGNCREGLRLFCEMLEKNVFANEITMLSLAIECGFIGDLQFGKWLHAYMLRNGFEFSVVLATAVVDMYGKCSAVMSARAVFDGMDERDVATWTAMISGYATAGCLDEAFDLFAQMRNANVRPNEVTLVNLLSLCAEKAALDRGKWIHSYVEREGIEFDVVLVTALINMYAKCGDINESYSVFTNAHNRDICMWNAMLCGLAMHGHGKEALELFSELQGTRLQSNDVTFIGVLHACSHAGLVAEGRQYFDQMAHQFGSVPKVEHYGCMVDLLGRAGLLDEAYEIIKTMPVKPNKIVWGALLAACKLHRNLSLGELAAKQLLQLEPDNCGYNVLLSNIYAAANRWNDVAEVRKAMKETGMKKTPGFSAIEVNGTIHEFIMGDCSHPKTVEIHEMLVEMNKKLKEVGYVANTSAVFLNIDEEEKETALAYHSEKLAMAFGFISTSPNSSIRIVKNLRVCDDCHSATKLLSKIYGRVIIVRDRNRFHCFSEGSCSCGDFW